MGFWLGRRRLLGLALKSPLSVLLSRGYLGHHMVLFSATVLHVVFCWESKRYTELGCLAEGVAWLELLNVLGSISLIPNFKLADGSLSAFYLQVPKVNTSHGVFAQKGQSCAG